MVSGTQSTNGMKGYAAITLASILWGTMGILAKLAYGYGISPEALIALRLTISFTTLAAILGLFSRKFFKIQKTDILLFLILGVFAIAFQRISYFYAVNLTTATLAAILFYTYPVFVTLYAVLSLKEKITFGTLLAIVLTFSGAALVVRVYDVASLSTNLVGIISGMLSSLLFVLFFIITKGLRNSYAGWTLTLYGDGTQTRSFCYVSDLISGLVKMMDTEDFIGPVNLGNPDEFSIIELAKKIILLTESSSGITHKSLPQDDPVQRCPDISLAKEKLDWQPRTSLEDGLHKTISYFKKVLS